MVFFYFFIFLTGCVFGSFLGVLTSRLPEGESIMGRSRCDHCHRKIAWYDNIPLLSFILLWGKCRYCKKRISVSHLTVELLTGIWAVLLAYFYFNCESSVEMVCRYVSGGGVFALIFLVAIFVILTVIFMIDLKYQYIPDVLICAGFLITLTYQIVSGFENFYVNLFFGFAASSFLLVLNFLTKGRGMGLGDVKFALMAGLLIGWPLGLTWLFLSFIIGAVVGLVLIALKKAQFGNKIAFGPFLVIALFISLFWGNLIYSYFRF